MSTEAYFKTAAANLRRAADEKRHEIDRVKQDFSIREQDSKKRIETLKQDKQQKEGQAASSNVDNRMRVELERQAQQDINQVSQEQQAFNRDRSETERVVNNMQREIADIERQASQLESRT